MEPLDFTDRVCDCLRAAGLRGVLPCPPDAGAHREWCSVAVAATGQEDAYFNLAFDTAMRVTVYVARVLDTDAMEDAMAAERALRTHAPDSANGSYRLNSIDTVKPRPVVWDESGRQVWVVEATAHIEIKEF